MTDQQITDLAITSPAARYPWRQRGRAPAGYIKGMALAYARLYAALRAGDQYAVFMAQANTHDAETDALSWYAGEFASQFDYPWMDINVNGPDALRATFTILWGLGMRESSGVYCCGRDRSADNVTADTAEAGLFQQSWDSHVASPLLPAMMANWVNSDLLVTFQEDVRCGPHDFENYGSGNGFAFQSLCKRDPGFAIEFAAVGLRVIRTHWGPIDRREVEVRPEVDDLLQHVEKIADAPIIVAQRLSVGPDTA